MPLSGGLTISIISGCVFLIRRTLVFLSFAINYFFGQNHPEGYHILNFIIHLIAVGLVWVTADVLFRIAPLSRSVDRAYTEIPFIIAVLFLVHPCQTQAVTYITQRFESLATVFYLGSIYFYLCGRIASCVKQKTILFLCSAGFIILGILTKEVAATIPLMILACEWIFFNTSLQRIIGGCSKIFKKEAIWKIFILWGTACFFFIMVFNKLAHLELDVICHKTIPSQSHDGDLITTKYYLLTQMRVFLTFLRLLSLAVSAKSRL